jgi:RNA polymerase sigma-70 factor, ECF subfamily
MTDAELIQHFRGGHQASLNLLLRRWQKRLYNFVLRFVGDRDEAGDLCQQVFIRVHSRLSSLREPERFSSWLYQIATNACLDWQKGRSGRRTQRLEVVESTGGVTHPGLTTGDGKTATDAAAHRRETSDLLSRALQEIPPDQRVVVVMKEYEGLKFTEIAAILQIPVNTAKSRLYYGLRALKAIFDGWGLNKESMGYEL